MSFCVLSTWSDDAFAAERSVLPNNLKKRFIPFDLFLMRSVLIIKSSGSRIRPSWVYITGNENTLLLTSESNSAVNRHPEGIAFRTKSPNSY